MKRLTVCLVTTLLLLTFLPTQLKAIESSAPAKATVAAESADATAWLSRLDEIREMDKSNLNSTERKQLRKEVRSIKGNLKEVGGGVYLSAGAIILLAVLLVLLL